ncbi:MAG TPA: class I SAM-dependent methyltransferase [Thermoanaerobaculia bacterium]|nr:class I SAM-dependent methyltransferase [Thermoanaerobaculia bacterium]
MDEAETIRRYYGALLPYYDEALAKRGDLPFWGSMATRWGAQRILELGCGTGRVTEVLVRHATVTAVDLLVEMLLPASRRAPAARLMAADLRRFALRETFDLIVLADDPMAHLTSLEDRAGVLRRIADHLTPHGRVVLEGLYRRPGMPPLVTSRHSAALSVEERWTPAAEASIWNASYRYEQGPSNVEVSSVMRSWSRAELDHVAGAGLEIESVWGDFDESPFMDDSPRIIVVAKRMPR